MAHAYLNILIIIWIVFKGQCRMCVLYMQLFVLKENIAILHLSRVVVA